jgi:hypothetical protein
MWAKEKEGLTCMELVCDKRETLIEEECGDESAYQPTNGRIGPFGDSSDDPGLYRGEGPQHGARGL